jgi:hypothetical protein
MRDVGIVAVKAPARGVRWDGSLRTAGPADLRCMRYLAAAGLSLSPSLREDDQPATH